MGRDESDKSVQLVYSGSSFIFCLWSVESSYGMLSFVSSQLSWSESRQVTGPLSYIFIIQIQLVNVGKPRGGNKSPSESFALLENCLAWRSDYWTNTDVLFSFLFSRPILMPSCDDDPCTEFLNLCWGLSVVIQRPCRKQRCFEIYSQSEFYRSSEN